jgi:hypothetical protein
MTIGDEELLRRTAEAEAWMAAGGVPGLRSPDLWPSERLVAAADRGVLVIPVSSAWWDDDPVPGQRQLFPRLPAPRGVE